MEESFSMKTRRWAITPFQRLIECLSDCIALCTFLYIWSTWMKKKNKEVKEVISNWLLTTLTCPNWSTWLFVNFTFWKLTVCLIHCAPVHGPSGWTYNRPGRWGSALPATVHSELWYLYRLSSTGTMSMTKMYFSFGFKPVMLILITGNIRLEEKKTMI